MKIQKIRPEIHSKLKEHLKGSSVFMQSYVEYLIEQAINKKIVYFMEERIKDISNYIHSEKLEENKKEKIVLSFVTEKNTNYPIFKIIPYNIDKFNENFNEDIIYYNLPNYNNVTNSNIQPPNVEGVIKYLGKSKIDGYPLFKMFINIDENVVDLLNIDNDLLNLNSLYVKCKIEEVSNFNLDKSFDIHRSFDTKTRIKPIKLKLNLNKHKDYSLNDFKKDLLVYVKSNFKSLEKELGVNSIFIKNDNKNDYNKIISRITQTSFCISAQSRIGPATHCIIPSYLIEHLKDFINIKENIDSSDAEKLLNEIGNIGNIKIFESDKVDDIYLYRSGEQGISLNYNFDKCNVDEINKSIINDNNEHFIYRFKIFNEEDTLDLNSTLNDKLKSLNIFEINDNYSPHNLEVQELIIDSKNVKDSKFKELDIDLNTSSYRIIVETIKDNIIKESLNTEGLKTEDFKIYGNERVQDVHEELLDMIDKYSINDEIPIILNGYLGASITECKDFKHNNIIKNKLISYKNIYKIGKIRNRLVYIDPFMLFNDTRILILNELQLKYPKNGIINYISRSNNDIKAQYSYKIDKDISIIKVIDKENLLV